MSTRIYWFRQQMNRPDDPFIEASIMGSGRIPIDDDVCRVAGLDPATCSAARYTARFQKYNEARHSAFTKVFRAWKKLVECLQ